MVRLTLLGGAVAPLFAAGAMARGVNLQVSVQAGGRIANADLGSGGFSIDGAGPAFDTSPLPIYGRYRGHVFCRNPPFCGTWPLPWH